MSAFLVNNETINVVVVGYKFTTFTSIMPEDAQRLGEKFLEMNQEALRQRYPHHDMVPTYEYKHRYLPDVTPVEAYKATQCLKYQCAEGDAPKGALFQELVSQELFLAEAIIRITQGYKDALWE